jgi:iron complex transport system permease protein
MVGSVTVAHAKPLLRWKLLRVMPALLAVTAVAAFISLELGYRIINPRDLWVNPELRAVFWQLRLPRVLLGGIVGASLSIVGAALQALFRNALAEPFTLGVSGGASLGASLAISLGLGATLAGLPAVFLFAFLGAGMTMAAVYYLASSKGVVIPGALLLSGVVLNFCASAGVLLLQFLTDYTRALQILRWMIGSLDTVGYGMVWRMLVLLLPAWLVMFAHARDLNLLAVGDESAAALGVDVRRVERHVYIASSLIVGVTAAASGSIGFVGLIVPHTARLLFGQDLRLILPASFLLGASFLMIADAIGRSVFSPSELPVGILTALLGGPFFLLLMRRERRVAAF